MEELQDSADGQSQAEKKLAHIPWLFFSELLQFLNLYNFFV